jgi:AraC family transcriptional regulator of adaptative response/methylated-DNA-[protein]-cysteine methyltransferase
MSIYNPDFDVAELSTDNTLRTCNGEWQTQDMDAEPYFAAFSNKGLCFLALGPIRTAREELAKRFPDRPAVEGDLEIGRMYIQRYLNGVRKPFPIPLELKGTDFQLSVWKRLMEVPAGETITYSELAKAIGCPGAQRAVARTCGANPIAVIVPCHRAVGKNDLGGYRWGERLKEQLIRRERFQNHIRELANRPNRTIPPYLLQAEDF